MGSHGIKDKVAIVGAGCIPFREHWDKGTDDMLIEASDLAFKSAGVTKHDVDAYWLGTAQSGMAGITLSIPLKLDGKPVTRVENFCATGSEAMRNAAYALAAGAYDMVMAIGVEKVKDSGYQGLNSTPIPTDGTGRTLTAAAMYSLILPAYAHKFGVDEDELRLAMARIASKNHFNGARNPRAQFRKEMTPESDLQHGRGRGSSRCVRLLGCGRWRRRGDHGARRRRQEVLRRPALHQGAVVHLRQRVGRHRSRVRLHDLPRDRSLRRRRLQASRRHRSSRRDRDGRGARLLHARPSSC